MLCHRIQKYSDSPVHTLSDLLRIYLKITGFAVEFAGCVWTGELDLNKPRVDGETFESGKKKLRIQKYPDTCGRGLSKYGEICTRYMNVSGNMFLCFIETDRRKNSLRKAPAKIESNLES